DICELAKAAGATYIARSTTYHINSTIRYLEKAIKHKGFSVVDVICDCPTLFGRFNKLGDVTQMMLKQKEQAIQFKKAQKMSPEDLEGKIITGELYENTQKLEYTDAYQKIIEKPEDVVGIKFRVMQTPIYIGLFKYLGSNAIPMPWGEVYTAIQQGVMDGLTIPIGTLKITRIKNINKSKNPIFIVPDLLL
ncbi:unnamed protein product, partial [marine sediment metagenome]